jgi:hypothetical protein
MLFISCSSRVLLVVLALELVLALGDAVPVSRSSVLVKVAVKVRVLVALLVVEEISSSDEVLEADRLEEDDKLERDTADEEATAHSALNAVKVTEYASRQLTHACMSGSTRILELACRWGYQERLTGQTAVRHPVVKPAAVDVAHSGVSTGPPLASQMAPHTSSASENWRRSRVRRRRTEVSSTDALTSPPLGIALTQQASRGTRTNA